jgi:hypothetical protein
MPTVFPIEAHFGSDHGIEAPEFFRRYADGTYRRVLEANVMTRDIRLVLKNMGESERDALDAFFTARKLSTGSGCEFYIYDFDEVDDIDLTGASTTGRHLAVFLDKRITIPRNGPCSWSCSLSIALLD